MLNFVLLLQHVKKHQCKRSAAYVLAAVCMQNSSVEHFKLTEKMLLLSFHPNRFFSSSHSHICACVCAVNQLVTCMANAVTYTHCSWVCVRVCKALAHCILLGGYVCCSKFPSAHTHTCGHGFAYHKRTLYIVPIWRGQQKQLKRIKSFRCTHVAYFNI